MEKRFGHKASIKDGAIIIAKKTNSIAVATGNGAWLMAEGPNSVAAATGYDSIIEVNGEHGVAVGNGHDNSAIASTPGSLAVAWGPHCKAKGCLGAILVLSEWEYRGSELADDGFFNEHYELIAQKLVVVDGENIKGGIWYHLVSGEVKEI